MKKLYLLSLLTTISSFLFAQGTDAVINVKEVTRIENILASDEMAGRGALMPEIEKAANFIANEFKSIGLKTLGKLPGYLQEFSMVQPKMISVSATLDGKVLDPKNIIVFTSQTELKFDQSSGYEVTVIEAGDNFFGKAMPLLQAARNRLVMIDASYGSEFPVLNSVKQSFFKSDKNIVFILGGGAPANFVIEAKHQFDEQKLSNVVGILPGKTKPDEFVIFSAHYDHLGITEPVNGDSVYNGANDDASGVTAVITLAKYFKELGNNARTLVFAAFTAEEVGGFGSRYFSKQLEPSKVVAMFNIEMIGTQSKWGKNSAYITGYEKSDMGSILQQDLEGSDFTFHPDPYPDQNLFYRSDNATLARLGVPAHTISTGKMDAEANYHQLNDEVKTLDLENMTMIIKSLAISSRSIISGDKTPSRVNTTELK